MRKIFLVFSALLVAASVSALTVLQLNVEQMTAQADLIVTGEVISVKEGFDPEGRPIQNVTIQVEEVIKGESPRRLTFKQLRPFRPEERAKMGGSLVEESLPRYERGEELVLFLSAPGSLGLTAPIGIIQGKFTVTTDGEGKKTVKNNVNNAGLFLKMKQSSSLKAFSSDEKKLVSQATPENLGYDSFISLVKKLVP